MTPKQRLVLRNMFGGCCAYCGCNLPDKGWHADHIDAVHRVTRWVHSTAERPGRYVATGQFYKPHNHRPDNYFPSCRACNIDKGSSDLEVWRTQLEGLPTLMRKYYANFRHAERFGIIGHIQGPVIFYFETFVKEPTNA